MAQIPPSFWCGTPNLPQRINNNQPHSHTFSQRVSLSSLSLSRTTFTVFTFFLFLDKKTFLSVFSNNHKKTQKCWRQKTLRSNSSEKQFRLRRFLSVFHLCLLLMLLITLFIITIMILLQTHLQSLIIVLMQNTKRFIRYNYIYGYREFWFLGFINFLFWLWPFIWIEKIFNGLVLVFCLMMKFDFLMDWKNLCDNQKLWENRL